MTRRNDSKPLPATFIADARAALERARKEDPHSPLPGFGAKPSPAPEPYGVEGPAPQVTSSDALEHMLEAQRGKTLRNARELLKEVQLLVQRLEAGEIPSQGLNVSTVGFLLTDHAQLITLRDTLDVVRDCEEKP